MATIKNLKQKVLSTLASVPATRNSDVELTLEIWRRYFPQRIRRTTAGEEGIFLRDIFDLPREDNVKRIRAHIQNDLGKFLPTNLEVAKQRGIEEKTWRDYMGSFHPGQNTALSI